MTQAEVEAAVCPGRRERCRLDRTSRVFVSITDMARSVLEGAQAFRTQTGLCRHSNQSRKRQFRRERVWRGQRLGGLFWLHPSIPGDRDRTVPRPSDAAECSATGAPRIHVWQTSPAPPKPARYALTKHESLEKKRRCNRFISGRILRHHQNECCISVTSRALFLRTHDPSLSARTFYSMLRRFLERQS
jgi:hypothetical protein